MDWNKYTVVVGNDVIGELCTRSWWAETRRSPYLPRDISMSQKLLLTGMVVHAYNAGTQEVDTGASQFKTSLEYITQGQLEIHIKSLPQNNKGWGCSPVVEHLPDMNSVRKETSKTTYY